MSEPVWLTVEIVVELHALQLAEFGGPKGIRDSGALASALERPRNKHEYADADIIACAAAYGYGLAMNHAFVDGNKRAAYFATGMFLEINGLRLTATHREATHAFYELAAGEVDEVGLEAWLRDYIETMP